MNKGGRKNGRVAGGTRASTIDRRLFAFRAATVAALAVIVVRLFVLQVLSHADYALLATGQHNIYRDLFPERGAIFLSDPQSPEGVFPAAVNKGMAMIYANPREVPDATSAAAELAALLDLDEAMLAEKLSRDDPYEPLKRRVDDETAEKVRELGIPGVKQVLERHRFYPEDTSVSHIIGFVGSDDSGERAGRYGIEGYWDGELAGEPGYLQTERDPVGRWIGTGERNIQPARDGVSLVLTIDRTVQYVACEKLRAAVERYGAAGGTVVIMEPSTGAVLAMCSVPDFDPNDFSRVEDIATFNNPAVFYPYEPGSVFKPFTMSAAIDAGSVTPSTVYNDEGSVVIGPFTIRNSDGKAHGYQSMTQVLEKSLNTGTIFAVGELGPERFREYVEAFGFGRVTGIGLDTEVAGDIDSLYKKGDIWSATASYGQGISVTPLQLVAAYGVLANGGKLMRPYIVDRVMRPDGTIEPTEPQVLRQVITKRAAALVGGMLVNVVENGHGKRAAVPGYWVAGKTGTAQIARRDGNGYEEDAFIGSFAGFAPIDDPAFVMLVRVDRPRDVQWAESTAAPLFGEIADFLLHYMEIPPERK